MAALDVEFEIRYSAARVVRLTNPDKRQPTAKDAPRLDAAVADAKAEFATITQSEYDEGDDNHVPIGVVLVEWALVKYGAGGTDTAQALRDQAVRLGESLKVMRARGRAAVKMTPIDSGYRITGVLPSTGDDRTIRT